MKGEKMFGTAGQPAPGAEKQGVIDRRIFAVLLALYLTLRDLANNQLYMFSDEERKKIGDRLSFIKKSLREMEAEMTEK